jgi:tetratricopeptide (TPR) repeat protein
MKSRFSGIALARLAGQFFVATWLAGCALLPAVPKNLQGTVHGQPAVELQSVPFFAQEDFFCGPSTLAMVLNHAGENTTPEKLSELVYLPGRKGSLQLEMLAAPRRLGYLSYQIEPTLPALFAALNAGQPVIVLLNLSLPMAPMWHYAVAVGYEAAGNHVILRSGAKERDLVPVATFLKLWERSQNWGFAVLKPGLETPPFATAQNYLNAIVALERSDPQKAGLAYEQGAKTWPTEPWFHFGLGNLAYTSQKYTEAEAHYRKAVGVYPDMADAWNNLAETLVKLNRKSEARAAINKAIAIGGNRMAAYRETAQKIPAD